MSLARNKNRKLIQTAVNKIHVSRKNRFKKWVNDLAEKFPRIKMSHYRQKLKWEVGIILCGIWVTIMTPLMVTFLYQDYLVHGSPGEKRVF
jgi:hypothetical protein